jgi:5'(3')-deoxyribonucleotidase
MKPTIYLDLDGMVVDLLARFAAMEGCSKAEALERNLDHHLSADEVFEGLKPLPGAVWAVGELQKMGHLVIASAPSRNPDSATSKLTWCAEHLPMIHRRDIALIKHKHLLRGDVWLDDWHGNIKAIRKHNPAAFIGAIAYPYNEKSYMLLDCRAPDWGSTEAAWEILVADVGRHLGE